jgi:ABC-2 type transport system permease protein
LSALWKLTATETRLFLREPTLVFFAVAFPAVLLAILGSVPSFRRPDQDLGGARVIDLYVPVITAMALGVFALNGLSQLFASYREQGVLRRMRTTPVKPEMLLGAQLLMATAVSVVTTAILLAIGRLAFDVGLPRRLVAYLVGYLLAALAMFAVGLLVASLAPTGKSAGAIGTLVFFPLVFFAGLWIPREHMNGVLRTISDFTPLGAGVQSLQDATAGDWPQPLHLAVMVGWTGVAGGLATRYFRWE